MKSESVMVVTVAFALTLLAFTAASFYPRASSRPSELHSAPGVDVVRAMATDAAGPPALATVPARSRPSAEHAPGCWARLYDKPDFGGDTLTFVGPIDLPRARMPSSLEWGRDYDSVVVGPRAKLTVYDGENFGERVARFVEGQSIADLDPMLGFFGNIRSLRVTCA